MNHSQIVSFTWGAADPVREEMPPLDRPQALDVVEGVRAWAETILQSEAG